MYYCTSDKKKQNLSSDYSSPASHSLRDCLEREKFSVCFLCVFNALFLHENKQIHVKSMHDSYKILAFQTGSGSLDGRPP
jgi:hypothetical protein